MRFTLFILFLFAIVTPSTAQTEDTWDTYISDFDGRPGSTMLNMSIVNVAPVKDFNYVLITGVTTVECTKDGFPTKQEFTKLYAVEEALIDLVSKNKVCKHVGSFTRQCQRLNFFYIKDTAGLRSALTDFYKTKFPIYKTYISIKLDQQWNTYLKFLYPNKETKEYMSNSKVVLQLTKAGDALTTPRQVDHWLYFKTAASRTIFIEYAKKNGFKVESNKLIKDGPLKYQLQISRVDKVDVSSISQVTIALNKEAKKQGGSYDGWETFIVK